MSHLFNIGDTVRIIGSGMMPKLYLPHIGLKGLIIRKIIGGAYEVRSTRCLKDQLLGLYESELQLVSPLELLAETAE